MKKLKDILYYYRNDLKNSNVLNAVYSAEAIIAFVLNCKRMDLYLYFDQIINDYELDKIERLIGRRKAKEPLQYILGSVEFYNCHLTVNKDVLIPRFETEQLVDFVIRDLKGDEKAVNNNGDLEKKKKIWDVCTGSGCIAIALKKAFPLFDIAASDISAASIKIAKHNAKENGSIIDFKIGDLLDPFKNEKADYIICNPPYVSEKEYEDLIEDVKDFEPKNALMAQEDGISYYKRLSGILPDFLNEKGKVFFEIGEKQKEPINNLFTDERWAFKKIYKDLTGKDRFFFLEIE